MTGHPRRSAAELLESVAVGDEGGQRDRTVTRLLRHAADPYPDAGTIALAALRDCYRPGDRDRLNRVADAVLLLGISLPTGRPWTPDQPLPGGGLSLTVKRCCNGCGEPIGDVTMDELDCAITGQPLPDVRDLCGCVRRPAEGASA